MTEAASPEFLEALARGLRVVEAFGSDRHRLTLAEIARAVDLPRASVRRILATLVQLGYAESDGRLFSLTPRVLTLAASYLRADPLVSLVQPVLERLSAMAGEPCSCAVLDGDEIVMVAHVSPKRLIAVSAQTGLRLPALWTSLGRVLLASCDDEAVDRVLARSKPKPLTSKTVTDKILLRRAIASVRSDGYALADQEVEIGFRSIAVPLRRRDGKTIAAINIGAHSERSSSADMRKKFLPLLLEAAKALQDQLTA
jgi:IclR family pca regulon transcriptional regulator